MLEVRVGRLHVAAHPLLLDWAPAQARLEEGWAAVARHRRRRIAAARLYVQVPQMPIVVHRRLSLCSERADL